MEHSLTFFFFNFSTFFVFSFPQTTVYKIFQNYTSFGWSSSSRPWKILALHNIQPVKKLECSFPWPIQRLWNLCVFVFQVISHPLYKSFLSKDHICASRFESFWQTSALLDQIKVKGKQDTKASDALWGSRGDRVLSYSFKLHFKELHSVYIYLLVIVSTCGHQTQVNCVFNI